MGVDAGAPQVTVVASGTVNTRTKMKQCTTRRFPEPALRASSPPGPILLLRDFAFFLFSASVGPAPRSTVALSLSTALVDLRVRRVVGKAVSPAMT